MQELVNLAVAPTICDSCAEPHAAVYLELGDVSFIMPVQEAKKLADALYQASLHAESETDAF